MGRDAKILRVFVASPNDVADERAALDVVVSEINNTQSRRVGAYLELVKWETHAFPGIASDPQDVINDEIGDDYDIFIGILSTRFGTATKTAESGTAEEFERSYRRFRQDPTEIRVMVYFKDPQIKASELDLDQYRSVRDFQKTLGEEGVLYWTFSSTEDFTTYVRMHLTRQLQDWADGKWGKSGDVGLADTPSPKGFVLGAVQTEDDLDLGFLDLIDAGEEYINNSTASLNRMTEALNELNEKLKDNTPRFTDAASSNDIKRLKHITNYIAEVMQQYSERTEIELPIFSQSWLAGMDALSRSATIWQSDFNSDDTSSIEALLINMQSLISTISESRSQIVLMEEAVTGLPRLTAVVNKAKRHTKDALNKLASELTTALNLTVDTEKELRRILESVNRRLNR